MRPRSARITGWVLAVVAAALSVLASLIGITDPNRTLSLAVVVLFGVLPVTFSLIGALIVSKRPDNKLGWLFAAGGLLMSVSSLTQSVGDRALTADPGSSVGAVASWGTELVDPPMLGLITVFLFLLFPEGHLSGRSERRVAWVAVVGIGLAMLGALVEPTLFDRGEIRAPLASGIPRGAATTLIVVGFTLLAAALVGSIVLLVRRLRRSTGREHDQLRLLAWAAAVATTLLLPAIASPTDASATYKNTVYLIGALGFSLIPLSVGVAILRHRLLGIDLVIRRTVVVALLGGFVTLVYVGVVVGVGALVGSSGNAVLSAVGAAIVALAFQPARRWAQRLANRIVYGERATPYEVLHDFSQRVAGAYGTEDVLPRMAAILGEGTGAERAQVWLRVGSEIRPAAAWPRDAARSEPKRTEGVELPEIPDVSHAVAVRDRDELLGALSLTKPPSEPVTETEERLVDDLALQAGLVLRNVRLVEDLKASRGRLVAAQDEERRRIERNIHDGAQQQLVALQVKQRLAEQLADRDPPKTKELLAQLQVETGQALQDLRDLARGIYPPLLADEGLVAALEAQARKATTPVTVLSDGVGRYAREAEATAYFCVLEALQNASKYAEATEIHVALEASEEALAFEVADDGRGFDQGSAPRGSGLQNMADRLEALGGSLHVRSEPGSGTRVRGSIPVVPGARP